MAAVTWKNIAPSNPSGLLSAANQAAKTMGEGISGIGTALQDGVDKKVESETNDFISDLMAAGSQEERDAMIGAANDSFLNLSKVNATNYELGEPDRAMDLFNQKLAAETVVGDRNRELDHLNELDLLVNKPTKYVKPTSGIGSTNFGKNPIGPNGIFATNYPKNDNTTGWGGGYDSADDEHFVNSRGKFLNSSFAKNFRDPTTGASLPMTNEMFNQLANDELITFEDRATGVPGFLGGGGDMFVFKDRDGNKFELDDSESSHAALAELIQNTYFKTDSTRQVNKQLYFDEFRKNNPDIVKDRGESGVQDLFTTIYNKNLKEGTQTYNKDLASQLFGKFETSGKTGEFDKDEVYQNAFDSAMSSFSGKAYDDKDIKRLFKTYSNSDINSKKDQAKLDALEVLVNAIK